jgi:nucleotide-binding universal stress UspA family protein
MTMTVVVGVDNSKASGAALRLAAQEARWRQVPLVAVSAYEPPRGQVGGFPGAAMHTEGEERATAEATLRATVNNELGDQTGETDLRISAGLAGRVIIETARQTHAQLVVLPARPGMTMEYVLLKARCPITLVPSEAAEEEKAGGDKGAKDDKGDSRSLSPGIPGRRPALPLSTSAESWLCVC